MTEIQSLTAYRIIQESLTNIYRHSRATKVNVRLFLEKLSPSSQLVISVADNGIGIAKDIQDKIFTRGFTTRAKEGGTGLGLYVVHEIIKSYGGKIYFDSSVKGTKFYAGIPLKRYKI
jgi:signal transduction histidine kinase